MLLSRLSLVLSALGCAVLLGFGSSPGLDFGEGLLALFCGLLAFLASGIVLLIAACQWRTHLSRLRLIAMHFAALALCGLLSKTTLPLSIRVLASEPWLRPNAHALLRDGAQRPTEPHWIGLFHARAGAVNGMAVFHTGEHGFSGSAGVVFSPTAPSSLGASQYSHLYGPWWRYRFRDDD
jgi:hypothetical protein